MRRKLFQSAFVLGCALAGAAWADTPPVTIQVDAAKDRHPIDPRIYGTAYASQADLSDLNTPLNRQGGNPTSRYNWTLNADNRATDYFFESLPYDSATPGAMVDSFISDSKTGGADAMITIPLTDWVAKLGPNRSPLASFSIKKYGPQTSNDEGGFSDAGDGVSQATGKPITGNDPNDANVPNSADFEMQWVQHLIGKWGNAQNGGVKYYLLDNESSIWYEAHRDVQPVGLKMDDFMKKAIEYASKIKALDPNAVIVGPEEWGWSGFFYSGYDQQYGGAHDFQSYPDKEAHGGVDYLPWMLDQFHQYDVQNGKRLLDLFTVHYYPQSGEFPLDGGADDVSTKMQLLRNESTRSLWDPAYKDKSWIDDKVNLIPRLKQWVAQHYPGTQIGLTEYNWGAENHINGATAQADVLGIMGREGVDAATRWVTPASSTPTYKAMKIYRNYDGKKSTFGDTGVSATGPNPDTMSTFAAVRSTDGALTVMVVNKNLTDASPVTVSLANFTAGAKAEEWQLTSANAIQHVADVAVANGSLAATVPAQSITLFVVPKSGDVPPPPTLAFTSSAKLSTAGALAPGANYSVSATFTATSGSINNAIVDVEVYDAGGNQVSQQYFEQQSFAAGTSHTYTANLKAPAAEGTYTVEMGVFNADWTQNPYWDNHATTFVVKAGGGPGLRGDLSGDGKLSIGDVILALRIAVGLDPATPDRLAVADMDGNGKITIADAIAILRLVVGL